MYGEMYRRHDQERYDAHINAAKEQAERGERITMVAAGALFPHKSQAEPPDLTTT